MHVPIALLAPAEALGWHLGKSGRRNGTDLTNQTKWSVVRIALSCALRSRGHADGSSPAPKTTCGSACRKRPADPRHPSCRAASGGARSWRPGGAARGNGGSMQSGKVGQDAARGRATGGAAREQRTVALRAPSLPAKRFRGSQFWNWNAMSRTPAREQNGGGNFKGFISIWRCHIWPRRGRPGMECAYSIWTSGSHFPMISQCAVRLTWEMRNASLGPKPGSILSISIDSKILEPPFFYLVLIL